MLDDRVLDLPIPNANKFNARMSEKLCQDILKKYVGEEDLNTRVRHIVLQIPGEFPDEASAAATMAVSPRTLRRQLGALGTSYREILDEVKADLAKQYLLNSDLNVDRIGQLLGYTETTNFRRAFVRWVGESPRKYRMRQ